MNDTELRVLRLVRPTPAPPTPVWRLFGRGLAAGWDYAGRSLAYREYEEMPRWSSAHDLREELAFHLAVWTRVVWPFLVALGLVLMASTIDYWSRA